MKHQIEENALKLEQNFKKRYTRIIINAITIEEVYESLIYFYEFVFQ